MRVGRPMGSASPTQAEVQLPASLTLCVSNLSSTQSLWVMEFLQRYEETHKGRKTNITIEVGNQPEAFSELSL